MNPNLSEHQIETRINRTFQPEDRISDKVKLKINI